MMLVLTLVWVHIHIAAVEGLIAIRVDMLMCIRQLGILLLLRRRLYIWPIHDIMTIIYILVGRAGTRKSNDRTMPAPTSIPIATTTTTSSSTISTTSTTSTTSTSAAAVIIVVIAVLKDLVPILIVFIVIIAVAVAVVRATRIRGQRRHERHQRLIGAPATAAAAKLRQDTF
jgi:hypothetical protein